VNTEPKPQRLQSLPYALTYAALVPRCQEIGREHGYAIAVHGSMATDLDLVAIPWVEEASDPQVLVDAICEMLCLMWNLEGFENPQEKPHGRLAWSLHINRKINDFSVGGPYLDISVMPRGTK